MSSSEEEDKESRDSYRYFGLNYYKVDLKKKRKKKTKVQKVFIILKKHSLIYIPFI